MISGAINIQTHYITLFLALTEQNKMNDYEAVSAVTRVLKTNQLDG